MSKIEVTKMNLINDENTKIKGRADILYEDCLVISGISVVDAGKKGLFVSMPNWCDDKGQYHDKAFPITAEARENINNHVMEAYNKQIEKINANKTKSVNIDASVNLICNRKEDSNLIAMADLTVNNELAVNGIRIYQGENGPFISMPTYKKKDGSYKETAYPVTSQMYTDINNTILNELDHELQKRKDSIEKQTAIGKAQTPVREQADAMER